MVLKAKAIAHPMQALVKYHGLRDWSLRIPYHDSLSVNLQSLSTTTVVEFGDFPEDTVTVDGVPVTGRGLERVLSVVDLVRGRASLEARVRVSSWNSMPSGTAKGLGFSSAAGAALAAASYKAAGVERQYGWDLRLISRIARRLAGSACRSVVGEYARWYAGTGDEDSYAERIAGQKDLDIRMVIVPLPADLSTEDAHRETELSPFFQARCKTAQLRCDELERAILDGDFTKFGNLVELDTLELHSVTMTGPRRLMLMTSQSLRVIELVLQLRQEGVEAYFSMQTGPSVFVNTLKEDAEYVAGQLADNGFRVVSSEIGGPVRIV